MKAIKRLHIANPGELANMSVATLNEALTEDGTLIVSGSPNADDLLRFGDWQNSLYLSGNPFLTPKKMKTLDLSRTDITEVPGYMMNEVGTAVNRHLQKVVLPESVTTINEGAFVNCTALHTVRASKGGTYGDFQGCTALTQMDLSGVTEVGKSAFMSSGLTTADHHRSYGL